MHVLTQDTGLVECEKNQQPPNKKKKGGVPTAEYPGLACLSPPRCHLSRAESRHGGKDAEGVAREEDDAVRVAPHSRRLVVIDVVDGVRHASVLRLGDVGVVGLTVALVAQRERG